VILGLTGSFGSGKSTVARMFEELGEARVIDADAIAHQVQTPGGAAYQEIHEAFGSGILCPDGTIDRRKLASIVFSDNAKRELLNSIVHPKVRMEELRLLEEYRNTPLVVLMVPLLLENRMERLADRIAVVTVTEEARLERLRKRQPISVEEIGRRLATQMPDAEKARLADFIIDNGGSLESTREQVKKIIQKVRNNRPSSR
jgi:dephospho-CoA kinase